MESTATRMLDSAEKLVQTMGFNWFSYADIAQELGVRKASLHHHFTTKGDLGLALIERYIRQFQRALEEIDARQVDAAAKLAHYAKLYEDVLRGKRLCLCGMLAAEYGSLPEPMQAAFAASSTSTRHGWHRSSRRDAVPANFTCRVPRATSQEC
jgi:TetR/AcrR family transcriptional repressor of nem operon